MPDVRPPPATPAPLATPAIPATPATPATPDRRDFLLELSRTSQEELMFRIGHRDNWLARQLMAQAILVALSLGIQIGGASFQSPSPTLVKPLISAEHLLIFC